MSNAPQPALKFDRTVNVPTLIAILTMLASLLVAGLSLYSNIDKRVTKNESDNRLQDMALEGYARESLQGRTDSTKQLDAISAKLDWLMRDRIDQSRKPTGQ